MAALFTATPAWPRDALGVFEHWGAFRDSRPARCFAISEPDQPPRAKGIAGAAWRPFAAIGFWPGRARGAQVHIRLSRTRRPDAPVTLTIGERRFTLVAGGADAWATDARMDAGIVAAMRSGRSMAIETRSARGTRFTDSYPLRGAATAIDAAALGCAGVRSQG